MVNGLGFLIILACVFGSFIMAGGKMDVILHALPHEMVAIGGAATGAFLVANSMRTVKLAGQGIGRAFKGSNWDGVRYQALLSLLFSLLDTFKKKGPRKRAAPRRAGGKQHLQPLSRRAGGPSTDRVHLRPRSSWCNIRRSNSRSSRLGC